MSYPIFKTDRGTVIDFKNGIWENGAYTEQSVKFINFAALNHHSSYCGATSAIKNYLGISDISGGSSGRLTGEYSNFHSFPFSSGHEPGMLGAEIAVFMKTIRKADLNITTAEWIGLSSRTNTPVVHTRAVLASTDPVALDYHATKYLLYPNSGISFHNPDNRQGALYQYVFKCSEEGGGVFDESHVAVESYDFNAMGLQSGPSFVVKGRKVWGFDVKNLAKYLTYRSS
jgi:hypothetical protein